MVLFFWDGGSTIQLKSRIILGKYLKRDGARGYTFWRTNVREMKFLEQLNLEKVVLIEVMIGIGIM